MFDPNQTQPVRRSGDSLILHDKPDCPVCARILDRLHETAQRAYLQWKVEKFINGEPAR